MRASMRLLAVILILLSVHVFSYSQSTGTSIMPPTSPPPAQSTPRRIDSLTARSLRLGIRSNGQLLGTATGFIVQKKERFYLVTNWHVLNDRRPDNLQSMNPQNLVPDQVIILYNLKDRLGQFIPLAEPLFDAQHKSRIIEHPQGRQVDVVFLPLTNTNQAALYATNLESRNTPILLEPTGNVSIIGFPFGNASYLGFPIWKSGAIASDPDIDYSDSPQFLVDTTGRPGMSGSPVYARRAGSYLTEDGGSVMFPGVADRFLGVYAGSIDGSSEVGRVWKASVVMDIYNSLP